MRQTGIVQQDSGPFTYAVYLDGKLVARAVDLEEAYVFFRFYATQGPAT